MFSFCVMLLLNAFTSTGAPMTTSYQPQFLWLLMGPLLGVLSGMAAGAALLLGFAAADSSVTTGTGVLSAVAWSLILGAMYGGICGAVPGFFVGLPLIFLVGRHLPRDVARRRAWVLGVVLPPFALVGTLSVMSGDVKMVGTGLPRGDDWWGLVPFLSASVLGGPLAARAAALDALPTPAS